jgi:hypothetical protein
MFLEQEYTERYIRIEGSELRSKGEEEARGEGRGTKNSAKKGRREKEEKNGSGHELQLSESTGHNS